VIRRACPGLDSDQITEIFESGFLKASALLMFANMEVRVDPEAAEIDN
jgi:hypothetical protein